MTKDFSKKKLCTDRCPLRIVMDRFGDKWSILILMALSENGTMRFNELSACIDGISLKVLTSTLRALEDDGFIIRTVFPEVPPKVEYELTTVGQEMIPYIQEISAWAIRNFKTK
ncbi:helix-turn-helix domain-containing protein [Prevotella sp. 10(H)]|uniref:winged helix-turn-helix transcriptional regulator n=1 Tax=Prevotella sp. 10(H) TaxID=1158294 RepID=UPI0004A71DC2|nr:helix-turn-helix domain-containing protein [Prevotella sp. 10(H)]